MTIGIVVAGVGVNGIIMESRGEARGEANRDKSEGESETGNWNKGSFVSPKILWTIIMVGMVMKLVLQAATNIKEGRRIC